MGDVLLICAKCGAIKGVSGEPCPSCGVHEQSVTVRVETLVLPAEVRVPDLTAQHGEPSSSPFRLETQTASGTRSDSSLSEGTISLEVHGAFDVGQKGERRVLHTFLHVLQDQGLEPELKPGRDAYGEDAILILFDQEYTLQVVTVPSSSKFWRRAAKGSSAIALPSDEAAELVRASVVDKASRTSRSERRVTLLVLDVRFAGVLGSKEVIAAYSAKYLDPSSD